MNGFIVVGFLFLACNIFNLGIFVQRKIARKNSSYVFFVHGLLMSGLMAASSFKSPDLWPAVPVPLVLDLTFPFAVYLFIKNRRSPNHEI